MNKVKDDSTSSSTIGSNNFIGEGDAAISRSCEKRNDGIPANTTATKKNGSRRNEEKIQMQKYSGSLDYSRSNINDGKGGGLLEIDDLFACKKEREAVEKQEEENAEKNAQRQKKRRKEEFQQNSSGKKIRLSHDRNDTGKVESGEWAQDGLGGVFDSEGFTGRREGTQGLKVYKAHLFNKKGFGSTEDCPFDCDCCYI
mmetsp:Transcript_25349/g.29858  ORF Transcript_25349/g.29858 Transcript_25349/m.29858 type:complete len:199 (+) Transcript_25349:133-729(+)